MSKPKFDATVAEEYLINLCVHYTDVRNQIFKRDNEGRDSVNFVYSDDYQKWLGMEIAIREVLEYFKTFEIQGGKGMSEYLFRGKRLNNKEWVYGYLCTSTNYIGDTNSKLSIQEGGYFRHVDPATVGQYTNLKDTKTGVKIFEGDKVRCYGGEHYDGYWEYNTIITIDNLTGDCFMMGEYEFLEIIGNIHEAQE